MSSSALPLDRTRDLPTGSEAVRPAERGTWWSRLGLDTLYLLVGFPVALASFVVLVTGVALSAGLVAAFLIGVPVFVATLLVAGVFAAIERGRLRLRGDVVPVAIYKPITGAGWRGLLNPFVDRQRWLDLAHGILVFPVAVVTWSLAVTWWAGALGGLTYPLWGWAIPRGDDEADTTLAELLGFDGFAADAVLNVLIGLFFAATLYAVIRGSAAVQAALGRQLLAGNYTRALQQRVATLEVSRSAAVQAEAQTLRKLERDLHDGPQQRLVRLDDGPVHRAAPARDRPRGRQAARDRGAAADPGGAGRAACAVPRHRAADPRRPRPARRRGRPGVAQHRAGFGRRRAAAWHATARGRRERDLLRRRRGAHQRRQAQWRDPGARLDPTHRSEFCRRRCPTTAKAARTRRKATASAA